MHARLNYAPPTNKRGAAIAIRMPWNVTPRRRVVARDYGLSFERQCAQLAAEIAKELDAKLIAVEAIERSTVIAIYDAETPAT